MVWVSKQLVNYFLLTDYPSWVIKPCSWWPIFRLFYKPMNIQDLLFGCTKSDHIYAMILPSLWIDPFLIITFSCGSRSMHPTRLSSWRSNVSLKMLGQKVYCKFFICFSRKLFWCTHQRMRRKLFWVNLPNILLDLKLCKTN